ncbi:MAG: ATP-binding protein [SAR324 cluster bacterium]|nr:ATP-binding protein [SAR324 cluster bacterium]
MGKRTLPIIIIFVFGLGLSGGAFFLTKEKILVLEESRFEAISTQHQNQMKLALKKLEKEAALMELLTSGKRLDFSKVIPQSFDWQFGWLYAELQNKKELKRLLREKRKDKDFHFHPEAKADAEFFMPVLWSLKDFDFIGLDLQSLDEPSLGLMLLAKDGGRKTWAPSLKNGGEWSKNYLIFAYSKKFTDSTLNLILGRLKLDQWLTEFARDNGLGNFGMDFSVESQGDSVLFPFAELPEKNLFLVKKQIRLFDLTLDVTYRSLASFTPAEVLFLPFAIAIAIGLLTVFFCFYLFRQAVLKAESDLIVVGQNRLRMLYETSIQEGFESHRVEDLVWKSLRNICEYADWPVGHAFVPDAHGVGGAGNIWYFQDEAKHAKFKEHSESKNFMTGHTLTDRVLTHSNYVWIPDISLDSTFTKSKNQINFGVKSAIGVPVFAQGEVKMVLEFFGENAVECDEHLMEKVGNLSKQLGGLIEAKWAEEKIATSIGSMKGALDILPQSVFLLDQTGRLSIMNYTASVNFGYNPSDVHGMNFEIFLNEPFQSKYKHFFEAYRENPKAQTFDGTKDVIGKRKDGTQLPIRLYMKEFLVDHLTYIVVLVSHPEKDNKLLKPTEKLEQVKPPDLGVGSLILEPKKPLVGQNLTVLEPLAKINELSKQLTLQPDAESISEGIMIQTAALEDTLEGLFSLSRMQDGSVELEKAPFLLNELVDQVLRRASPRVYSKGIELVANIQSDVPVKLIGDAFHLSQMLLLLIDNSARYVEEGEIYLEVKCYQSDLYQAQLMFLVRDSGCGIPPSLSQALMTQIRQDDRTVIKREDKKLGLTLSYVKELAHLMNAQVSINSIAGEWSSIAFTTFVGRQSEEIGHIGLEKSLGNLYALLIDHNEIQRKVLQKRLAYHGARVQMCGDFNEGTTKLLDAKNMKMSFDCVLVNGKGRGVDLSNFLSSIRAIKEERPFVIVLSEGGKVEFGDYPNELCHVLLKPVDLGQPFDLIAKIIADRA